VYARLVLGRDPVTDDDPILVSRAGATTMHTRPVRSQSYYHNRSEMLKNGTCNVHYAAECAISSKPNASEEEKLFLWNVLHRRERRGRP
jgi:hypothetical protein